MKRTPRRTPTELPDVRDGLTRVERIMLVELQKLSAERGGRHVAAFELYGRVCEQVNLSQREFLALLTKLVRR